MTPPTLFIVKWFCLLSLDNFDEVNLEEEGLVGADLLTCTFTINDTRERLRLLKQYLDVNGYKYTN